LPQKALDHMPATALGNLPPAIARPTIDVGGVFDPDGPFGAAFYFYSSGADERFLFNAGAVDVLIIDVDIDRFGEADAFGDDVVAGFEPHLDIIFFEGSYRSVIERKAQVEHEYLAVQLADGTDPALLYEVGVLHRATHLVTREVLVEEILPIVVGTVTVGDYVTL
jgi:hypothetical protein